MVFVVVEVFAVGKQVEAHSYVFYHGFSSWLNPSCFADQMKL
jgi:hypothetical protein